MSRRPIVAVVLVLLALGEGCVLLAEKNNNTSTHDLIILSLIMAPCFGAFLAIPLMVIGAVIAAIRYPR